MIKKLFQTTDNFLCSRVKNVFEKTEKAYIEKKYDVDILQELQKFQENPLGCMIGNDSKFETTVKIKIKIVLGVFFVLIPLLGFNVLSYISNIPATYAFILTFFVAVLVASRIEEIVNRYVQTRTLQVINNY